MTDTRAAPRPGRRRSSRLSRSRSRSAIRAARTRRRRTARASPIADPRSTHEMPDAVVALGHRRLSIVDLTPAGHQPMATPDRRYWIVYNGEIYNHVELARGARSARACVRVAQRHRGHPGRLAATGASVASSASTACSPSCSSTASPGEVVRRCAIASASSRCIVALAARTASRSRPRSSSSRCCRAGMRASSGQRPTTSWIGALDHSGETLFAGVRQLRGGELLVTARSASLAAVRRSGDGNAEATDFRGTCAERRSEFRDSLHRRRAPSLALPMCRWVLVFQAASTRPRSSAWPTRCFASPPRRRTQDFLRRVRSQALRRTASSPKRCRDNRGRRSFRPTRTGQTHSHRSSG